MSATRPPLANSGRPCSLGSTTRSSSRLTTCLSTGACSKRVAPSMVFVCQDYLSPVRSNWRARSGASTRHGCPMFADGSASRYDTTRSDPTRKRARVLCLPPSERDGVVGNSHARAHAYKVMKAWIVESDQIQHRIAAEAGDGPPARTKSAPRTGACKPRSCPNRRLRRWPLRCTVPAPGWRPDDGLPRPRFRGRDRWASGATWAACQEGTDCGCGPRTRPARL